MDNLLWTLMTNNIKDSDYQKYSELKRITDPQELYDFFKTNFDKDENEHRGFIPFFEAICYHFPQQKISVEQAEKVFLDMYTSVYESDENHFLFDLEGCNNLKLLGKLRGWTQTTSVSLQLRKIEASQVMKNGLTAINIYSTTPIDNRELPEGITFVEGRKQDWMVAEILANPNRRIIIFEDKPKLVRIENDNIQTPTSGIIGDILTGLTEKLADRSNQTKPIIVHIPVNSRGNTHLTPRFIEQDNAVVLVGCNSIGQAIVFLQKNQTYSINPEDTDVYCDFDDTLHRTTEVTHQIINAIYYQMYDK